MRIVISPGTLDNIWKTEFDDVFLRQLELKTTELYEETISLNRLGSNRATLRGLKRGSRLHVAATIIVQRGGCTGSETPLSSDATGFQSLIQEVLIECWARHHGLWREDTSKYLKEKFGRTSSGNFAIIIKQPFIKIDNILVSDREVIDFMSASGFEETNDTHLGNFKASVHSEFANADFFIADLHKENIVKFSDSGRTHYFVLDCAAYYNTPGLGIGGSYDVGEPEGWAYKNENDWKYDMKIIDNPLDFQ